MRPSEWSLFTLCSLSACCLEVRLLHHGSGLCYVVVVQLNLPPSSCSRHGGGRHTAPGGDVRLLHLDLAQLTEASRARTGPSTARHQAKERLAKVVGQKRVENRIDAAVHVGQTVGDHLGDSERQCHVVD